MDVKKSILVQPAWACQMRCTIKRTEGLGNAVLANAFNKSGKVGASHPTLETAKCSNKLGASICKSPPSI